MYQTQRKLIRIEQWLVDYFKTTYEIHIMNIMYNGMEEIILLQFNNALPNQYSI